MAPMLAAPMSGSNPVPQFEINLDLPPEERFTEISQRFHDQFQAFFNKFGNNMASLGFNQNVANLRGPENPEFMGEIRGLAQGSGAPEAYIQGQHFQAPLQTLKGPYFRYLHSMNLSLPTDEDMLSDFQQNMLQSVQQNLQPNFTWNFSFPSIACAGIIARDEDGTVWHARNLDYGWSNWLQKLTYLGVFTKGGKEIFTGQMVYPLVNPLTAIRKGANGYSYELNTRFSRNAGDATELMKNLYQEKRPLSGWTARKVLENTDNYEDAVKAFSTIPYPDPEYNIISGVKKGTILARDPDGLAYQLDLDQHRYILMTNFDYLYNDEMEFYVSPGDKETGFAKRMRIQQTLNSSKVITPELLQNVLANDAMEPSTIFSAMINVELGTYNSTLPPCAGCAESTAQAK